MQYELTEEILHDVHEVKTPSLKKVKLLSYSSRWNVKGCSRERWGVVKKRRYLLCTIK